MTHAGTGHQVTPAELSMDTNMVQSLSQEGFTHYLLHLSSLPSV